MQKSYLIDFAREGPVPTSKLEPDFGHQGGREGRCPTSCTLHSGQATTTVETLHLLGRPPVLASCHALRERLQLLNCWVSRDNQVLKMEMDTLRTNVVQSMYITALCDENIFEIYTTLGRILEEGFKIKSSPGRYQVLRQARVRSPSGSLGASDLQNSVD